MTAAAVTAAEALPATWRSAAGSTSSDGVADHVVALCATALAVALGWLWVVTTATVAGLLAGSTRTRGGATRHLVLLACGVAVVAGTGLPAAAAGGDGPELLVGLRLPERAVAPARHHDAPGHVTTTSVTAAPTDDYVVRSGDSLWSIARAHPAGASTDERWRAIWRANRDVVGDDPDLIHPGQALRLPDTTPTPPTPHPTWTEIDDEHTGHH